MEIIDDLNEFQQQDLHLSMDESEKVLSFHSKFYKTSYINKLSLPFTIKEIRTGGSHIVYSINPEDARIQYLSRSYLRQLWPTIRVLPELKNKIRIAWCLNHATNIVSDCHLKFKEEGSDEKNFTIVPGFDSVYLDFHHQLYRNKSTSETEKELGNYSKYIEFSDYLPEHVTNAFQPWPYARHKNDLRNSLPLFLGVEVEHEYDLKNNIADLLKMQEYIEKEKEGEGEWRDIECNFKYIEISGAYCNPKKKSMLLPPELWGKFLRSTEADLMYMRQFPDISFYYPILKMVDVEIEEPEENEISVLLDTSPYPCDVIMFAASNNEDLSNYKKDLISYFNITEGQEDEDYTGLISDDQFSAEMEGHFPKLPYRKGYVAYSLNWNSNSLDAQSGIVYDEKRNGKLMIGINNRILNRETIIQIRLRCTSRLKFTKKEKKDGDSDGEKYRVEFFK